MGLGPAEMAIIFVVVLLLFGAKKLPELARGMGKAMGEFKSARQEFEREIRRAEYEITAEPKRQLAAPRPAAASTTSPSTSSTTVAGSESDTAQSHAADSTEPTATAGMDTEKQSEHS